MYPPDLRYPFFWMGLEALFGADDGAEIGYKLAQRISFFLPDTPEVARDLFKKVKTCYGMAPKSFTDGGKTIHRSIRSWGIQKLLFGPSCAA